MIRGSLISVLLTLLVFSVSIQAQIVINEVDYDQASTDTAEFVELYNTSATAVDLTNYTLELVNGSNNSVYATINLPATVLPPYGYFVICANNATVANCDLDSTPDTNFIQNGAPDGMQLKNNGSVQDSLSYEGDIPGVVEGTGAGADSTTAGIGLARTINGVDTDDNSADFSQLPITPGASNNPASPTLVINEVDYDQASTDTDEFVEIYNVSGGPIDLSTYSLIFVNGSNTTVYNTIPLSNVILAADDYFVVCANNATVANCDLDSAPDTNFIQNGAPDGMVLVNNVTPVDSLSYEGDIPGIVEGTGAGADSTTAGISLSRTVNGVDTDDNSADFSQLPITPGANNNPPPPEFTINDVTLNEGDAGTTSFDFTITISAAADASVEVDTADDTATAGSDYVAVAMQTVNFTAVGPTTQTVTVTVNGDTTVEADETFFVNLSNPTGAVITDSQGVGTITNDDSANISIDDVTISEGNAGTTNFDFTVSIDQSVNASVEVNTADGTATTADNDYNAINMQAVNFTAGGSTTQTVTVAVNGDLVIEGDENFFVNLSNASGALISDSQGVGTISNDDNVQAVLSAVKSVSGELIPGGTATYTIVISNTGPNPQSDNPGDEMTDVLPSELTFVSANASSGIVSNVGNIVSWNGSIPAASSVTVTIVADISPNAVGQIDNQAEVFFDNDGDNTNESSALSNSPIAGGPTGFFIPYVIPANNIYALILLLMLVAFSASRRIRK